jgi:hypothetical protein
MSVVVSLNQELLEKAINDASKEVSKKVEKEDWGTFVRGAESGLRSIRGPLPQEGKEFDEITSLIKKAVLDVYIYGKEKVSDWVDKITNLFDEAKESVGDKVSEYIKRIKEFISEIFNNMYQLCMDLIPAKIKTEDGIYNLNNVSFSQSFSLQGGIKASLTELLDFAASGQVGMNVSYNFRFHEEGPRLR